jgi:hypothetical protein
MMHIAAQRSETIKMLAKYEDFDCTYQAQIDSHTGKLLSTMFDKDVREEHVSFLMMLNRKSATAETFITFFEDDIELLKYIVDYYQCEKLKIDISIMLKKRKRMAVPSKCIRILKSYINHLLFMYMTDTYYLKSKTFEKWVSRLAEIGEQQKLDKKGKHLFQFCSLLMCLVKWNNGKLYDADQFSCTFDSMMNIYYKFLNHETIADVLQNTSIRNGIFTRSFPISIGKGNVLYVFYDTFLRIVDVQVNHDYGIMSHLIDVPFDLNYNWRGKHYYYSYIFTFPITGWSKIEKNMDKFIESLSYETENCGNWEYYRIIDNDMYDAMTRSEIENRIFKRGYTCPPIDYDCKFEECDCNGENSIDLDKCKSTVNNFMSFTKKKLYVCKNI